jgi:DNA-binding transcriptional regulator YdaS (Cro superfamily)
MSTAALERAVKIVGGQKPLADLLGTTQSQVWYWLSRAKRGVPGEYVIPIEQATQSQVTRYDLRPDLYPRPSVPTEAA